MISTRTTSIRDLKIRAASDGSPIIEGYAAVFNSPSLPLWELGGRRELIRPGAFSNALKRGDDVRLLINHDPNLILARSNATLTLTEDEAGLFFSASLGNQSYARDLVESMKTGLISQCSFGFEPQLEGVEVINGEEFNVVRDAGKLLDVSAVTYPAYPATVAMVRSLLPNLSNQDVTDLLDAIKRLNTNADSNVSSVVDNLDRLKREIELLAL